MADELYVIFVSLALMLAVGFAVLVWQLLRATANKGTLAGLTLLTALLGFVSTIPFGMTRGWWLTVLAGGFYVLTMLTGVLYAQVRDVPVRDRSS